MVRYYEEWVKKYPIISIEDGMAETDWDGWKIMTDALGGKIQLVGDEGGFAPSLKSNEEAVEVILEAIGKAGYEPGKDVYLAQTERGSARRCRESLSKAGRDRP